MSTRRSFLATSTGAALAAATTVVTSPLVLAADDPPLKRINVGVMGVSRGKSLAQSFSQIPGVYVTHLCDVDSERLAAAQTELEKALGYTPQTSGDIRELCNNPEIDAIVVAAPNHWHAPGAILAVTSGKHAYVEKPCCHNPREGELLVEAARKHNKAVQMGNQRRSAPGFIEGIQKLHDGIIGRVYHSRSTYHALRESIGTGKPADVPARLNYDHWQGPAPRVPYFDNRVHYNWHWFWHWGNGELGNNGIHSIDVSRWGLGADYPIRVVSGGGRYRFKDDQQTADTHSVAFEFPDGRMAVWDCLSCNQHKEIFCVFHGEKGTLEFDESGSYKIMDIDNKLVEEAKHTRTDVEHIQNFVDAIRNDTPLQLNSEILEGHKSTLLCHLGNIAHRTGRTLTCRASDGHILGDDEAQKLWSRDYEPGWEPKV